jgi:imidazolonepropionase-like amidohydrolase
MEEEYNFPRLAKVVADIVNAGGKAGVGSHGQLQGLGYHWELWAMQSGGLTEHQALRVATLFGAEAIGVQNDVGSIEPGKLADLVIFEQSPLDGMRNTNTIQMVMKNGRLYDGDSLEEIWPRQRELGPVYGLGDRPVRIGGGS